MSSAQKFHATNEIHDTNPLVATATRTPQFSSTAETRASAVEVRISWGKNLIYVAHLAPVRSFYVGESLGRSSHVDYALPANKLGAGRMAVVELTDGAPFVVVPPNGVGFVEHAATGERTALRDASPNGRVALHCGVNVRIELDDLVFEVQGIARARKVAGAVTLAALATGSALAYVLGAGVGVGGLLAAAAFFTPDLNRTPDDEMNDDKRYLISHYLEVVAERERTERPNEQLTETTPGSEKENGGGVGAKGTAGSMGTPAASAKGRRFAVEGPESNPDPHIGRQAALRDAAEFGMIGLLKNGAGADVDAPTAPWGRDDSLGSDPMSARGSMWGDAPGESSGIGGRGLTGIGEGGDGPGEGLGLGSIGTLGHGSGSGKGTGFGVAGGYVSRRHATAAPVVRMGVTSFNGGRLPPETIQSIVRQNFGRFRFCYENGLRQNPTLEGTVSVLFVIGRDGSVASVGGGGSLPDAGVVNCVARAFQGLSFPAPDGGVVRVSYPISFHPG